MLLRSTINKIPEQVNVTASLKTHNNQLWNTVHQFYREVRNPISHGYQLWDVKAESLREVFLMFDQIYSWIDSCADPHRIQKILASTTLEMLQ
jgi:hypothetical protein